MANNQRGDYPALIDEAKQFLRFANEADTMNRQEALEDLKFVNGEQWPIELQNSRNLESRPVLTINKVDTYCRQVANQQRQQRPRIKVHGMNTVQDAAEAEIIQGLIRHIEVNSNAETAYDTAFDYAVRMGWGYLRIRTDYISEDSFDQEIFIDPINNPFTVYFDPNSVLPDGSDAEKAMITTVISKEVFKKQYPDADDTNWTVRGTGDSQNEWIMKEDIRIAEYFYTQRKKTKLYLLSDGSHVFEEEMPSGEQLAAAGITIISKRDSFRKVIKWAKLTGDQILEERDLPGKYIPIVPVYGREIVVGDKRKRFGMVRFAKDPQRLYNFWQTALTESVALAPKAKWIMAEGQDEGHESDWAQANIKSTPYLRYKQTDIEGRPAPAPQRLQPEPPPAGVITAAQGFSQDLQAVMGIFDPNQLPTGNISGKALNGQQQQIDLTNYDYYDNLTRSLCHVGKIILNLIPYIYDTERVMRIIGDDGKPETLTINQRDASGRVVNDVTVGQYDVVMETGPGYNSKRQAAVDAMLPLLSTNGELFNIAGDLVFRNMDFPGADTIADRLATMNPLAQIDTKSDVPPQVQMAMQQSQAQVKQMQEQMQQMQLAMKYRTDVEAVKQDAETKRELMRQTGKAFNTETLAEVKVHDQNTRAVTSQNKMEIEAIMELLLHHMDTARLNQEIEKRNAEQQRAMNIAMSDIESGGNPLAQ